MSFITVQLGQCGNQIGTEFFDFIANDVHRSSPSGCQRKALEDYKLDTTNRYFYSSDSHEPLKPKSILIDMEQKVVNESIAISHQSKHWKYSPRQTYSQRAGSGNNWAYGYSVYGNRCHDDITDLIRKQTEQCDRTCGFMCLMSLAGGTGSGLGTYVSGLLRDDYPRSFIFNQVVAPYRSGEVILQSYNALLTLSHLSQVSDGILIIENDIIQQICTGLLCLKNVSFKHLNSVIARKMAAMFCPASSPQGTPNHLGVYMDALFSSPTYKLSSLLTLPIIAKENLKFSTFSWTPIMNTLTQMLIAKSHMEEGINWRMKVRPGSEYNKSVSNIAVLRGPQSSCQELSSINQAAMYPPWLPESHRCPSFLSEHSIGGYEKSCSLLTNSQIAIPCVDSLVEKAWNMFSSRAFLHQYSKHGVDRQQFLDCFYALEKVIADYRCL